MCDVQAARMVATCTADHFLSPSNFPGHTSRLPAPHHGFLFLEPRNLPTFLPLGELTLLSALPEELF